MIEATHKVTYRISKDGYPPVSGPARAKDGDRATWNRYDTVGTTAYFADTAICAYSEVLDGFKRAHGSVDPWQKDADSMGMTLEEYYESVLSDWEERSFMATGTLPRIWRTVRKLHSVALPAKGWWVHVEARDSLSALEVLASNELSSLGISSLNTGHTRGDNRKLTTMLADTIRDCTLFDGSRPLGIIYESKHATGVNYALYLRKHDDGSIVGEGERVIDSAHIPFNDKDLSDAAAQFRIKVF